MNKVFSSLARKARLFNIFMILLLLLAFSHSTVTQAASDDGNAPSTQTNASPVFADDFERGNLSAWSGSVKDGGNLRVKASAAYQGSYGLEAYINDRHNLYVTDNTPGSYLPPAPPLGYTYTQYYSASFFFNPNSLKMKSGNEHNIFEGVSINREKGATKTGSASVMFRLALRKRSGNYQLVAYALNGTTWLASTPYTINNGWQRIEILWMPYTGIGFNPWGSMTLKIDGSEVARIGRLGSATAPSQIRLGATSGVDKGTSGRMFFDNFESWYSYSLSRLYW